MKGWLLSDQGELVDAKEVLLEFYTSYLRCNDLGGASRTLNRMAWVSFHLGEIESSIENLRKCAETYRRLSRPDSEALVRNNLAYFLWASGQLSASIEEYLRIRGRVTKHSRREAAIHYFMSAIPYALKGDLATARETIGKAWPSLDQYPREKAIYFENLGLICVLDRDYKGAEGALKKGLRISL